MEQTYEGYDNVEVYTYGEAFWLARRGTFVFGGVSYPPVFFCFCFSLADWFVVLRERLTVWLVGG